MAPFGLNHVSVVMLGVRDLNRAVSFYRDVLNLALKTQFPGFAFFDGGGVTLALSEPLAKAKPQGAGATEIVFSVPDVMPAYQALLAKGVKFAREPRIVAGSDWAANFDDPDGHTLSILGPNRGSS
ncbi:MAG TPA: VOC family protein [Candidatus Acidoferrales bacterium]|nr:VOC family protein [Candidatus Acidoferrales bacterium]